MRAVVAALCSVVLLGACYMRQQGYRPELTSFTVTVSGVYLPRVPQAGKDRVEFGDPGTPLQVVSECAQRFGGEANVPAEERGTSDCAYLIPRGEVDIDVQVIARGKDGKPLEDFTGPVSFRVVPGDFTAGYDYRWMDVKNGVGKGVVKVNHLYSKVRVWVEDAPVAVMHADGGVISEDLPGEPEERTWASGASGDLFFEEPTIAKIQIPDGYDNRSSPFIGQFLTIGRPPESGATLKQTCSDDPENDGKEALLVVTGTDPTGFFVTDITACKQKEDVSSAAGVRVPEPSTFLPGTYGSLFIYNYSFPEGLDQGDLLWSVAGASQEFTSTTQLTFPSWTVAERVRELPEAEWNKWLSKAPIVDLNLRHCGLDDQPEPFVTDVLCGHNRRNLKMESMESGLVRARNVKFPQVFTNCDRDGDGEVPFFCEQRNQDGVWIFGECGNFDGSGSTLTPIEQEEVACNIACVSGQAVYAGTLCSERATFSTFGQFIAEMAGPGPSELGYDDSLMARIEDVGLSASSAQSQQTFLPGSTVRVFCTADARVKFGGNDVEATAADTQVAAGSVFEQVVAPAAGNVAVIAEGAAPAGAKCQVALNSNTRINVVTKDAIPELKPDCDPNAADAEEAAQCKNLRGARYDVTGHLRHLQPGRPRWVILPRDKDDVCCYPGPGLECPKPIQPCN